MTTKERNLLIARAMKLDIRTYGKMLLSYDDRLGNVDWCPDEDAEQCLMVLEWLLDKETYPDKLFADIAEHWAETQDFKQAVCQAVENYLTLKNQK